MSKKPRFPRNMPFSKKDHAELARRYIAALRKNPMCRFCFKDDSEVNLTRVSEHPMRDTIYRLFPPALYGLTEDELPDWFCDECRTSLITKKDLERRAVIHQIMMPVRPAKFVPVGDQIRNDLAALEGTSRKRQRSVDMATIVPNEAGPQLTAQQRHRELLEATRIRLNFSACVLTPPRRDGAGEGPSDEAADVDVLYDEKRVPDILTETMSSEEDLMSSTRCSGARTISEDDFPITLLDPSHECSRCTLMFATTQQVGWHGRVHTSRGQLRCRYCPSSCQFERVSAYLRHVRRQHAGLRRTQCLLCDEHFSLPSNFKTVHEQYHEHTRMKYACSFCPLIFNRYKKLRQHRQQMHNDWRLMCRDSREVQNDAQPEAVADE